MAVGRIVHKIAFWTAISGTVAMCVCILFCGSTIVAEMNGIVPPWFRANAIETTLEWGGLADLPADATNISITTEGSAFTRSFHLKFQSSETEIKRWREASLRLKDATPVLETDDRLKYEIYPGESDAAGGWVEISKQTWRVHIYMMWS